MEKMVKKFMKEIYFWNKHGYFLGQVLTFSPPTECWHIYKQNPLQKPKLFSQSVLTSVNQELRDSHLISSSIKLFEDQDPTPPFFLLFDGQCSNIIHPLHWVWSVFSKPLHPSSHPSFQYLSLPATLYTPPIVFRLHILFTSDSALIS